MVGADRIMWEMDYPHSDSTWPDAPEQLWENFDGVSAADVDKITHGNAMRAFSFDPFAHRPRESCTVAALRAEAADVDTSIRSQGRRKADVAGLTAKLAEAGSRGVATAS